MSNIPEPWATAMIEAGFKDPRYADDRPSLGALADAAGIHTTTVSRMVHKTGAAKTQNVAAVARALRKDVVEVSAWVRQARTETEPYTAPPEADLLNRRERAALDELIRAVTETRREGGGHGRRPAPIGEFSEAGGETFAGPVEEGASRGDGPGRGRSGRV